MKTIYSMYGAPIGRVTNRQAATIAAFCRTVPQQVGMGGMGTPPKGVTVNFWHTYGSGGACIYFRGAQIASA
jgi:hypothetical protein